MGVGPPVCAAVCHRSVTLGRPAPSLLNPVRLKPCAANTYHPCTAAVLPLPTGPEAQVEALRQLYIFTAGVIVSQHARGEALRRMEADCASRFASLQAAAGRLLERQRALLAAQAGLETHLRGLASESGRCWDGSLRRMPAWVHRSCPLDPRALCRPHTCAAPAVCTSPDCSDPQATRSTWTCSLPRCPPWAAGPRPAPQPWLPPRPWLRSSSRGWVSPGRAVEVAVQGQPRAGPQATWRRRWRSRGTAWRAPRRPPWVLHPWVPGSPLAAKQGPSCR